MSPFPADLPGFINIAGHCRDVADRMYGQFETDFKQSQVEHRGIPVHHDRKAGNLGYEDGFWHMITREDKSRGNRRFFEGKRAAKLPWAKELLQCAAHPRIRTWDYDSGRKRKGVRTYVWLEDWDYVVILKRIGRPYMLVTAYDVDDANTRCYFERLYANRV
ncbi:MAG: hypothetical protein Q8S43_07800 [Actinomycetota bacterium]|nr:hypothetical protein [Actinomycetota bacterium]MDP3630837.1 hypothetical protein [Actinomycetota bacterium]